MHLSAGDLLRAERDSGSPDGDLINSYIADGKIVPVVITCRLIKNAMENSLRPKLDLQIIPEEIK